MSDSSQITKKQILSEILNEAGYKKHSKINPLILQSKALDLVEKWIRFHMLNECPEEPTNFGGKIQRLCGRDCAECPYEKLLEKLK